MSDNVVSLQHSDSEQADAVIEEAKGKYQDVLVIGWDKDSNLRIDSSEAFLSAPHRFFILEAAKLEAINRAFEEG